MGCQALYSSAEVKNLVIDHLPPKTSLKMQTSIKRFEVCQHKCLWKTCGYYSFCRKRTQFENIFEVTHVALCSIRNQLWTSIKIWGGISHTCVHTHTHHCMKRLSSAHRYSSSCHPVHFTDMFVGRSIRVWTALAMSSWQFIFSGSVHGQLPCRIKICIRGSNGA